MFERDLIFTDETNNFEPSANNDGSLEIADLCRSLLPLFSESQCLSGQIVEDELARRQLEVTAWGFDTWKELWDYAVDVKEYFDVVVEEQGEYSLSLKPRYFPLEQENKPNDKTTQQQKKQKTPNDPLHDKIIELIVDLRNKERTSPPGFVSLHGLHEALIGAGHVLPEELSQEKLKELLQNHPEFYQVQECKGDWECAGQMIVRLKRKVIPPEGEGIEKEKKNNGGEEKTKDKGTKPGNHSKVTKCSPFKLHDLVLFDNYDASLQHLAALAPQSKGQNWHAIENRDEDHPLYYLGLLLELNFGNVAISSDSGTLTYPSNFHLSLSSLVFFSGFYTEAGKPIFAVCEHLADTCHYQQYRFVKFEVR